MLERELQRKIEDLRAVGLPAYVPRDGAIHMVDRTVSTVVGARRAGKSFRVLQAADDLIRRGVIDGLEHVCHVDFDNPILSTMAARDLGLVQSTFLRLAPRAGLGTPLLFVFDEIHRIQGWEDYLIDLSRNPRWKVIVTGSSSRLLRDDVSTSLRGKAIATTVYPLSFAEYLRFAPLQAKPATTRGRAEARTRFDSYLAWGGFPAMPATDERSREALLREYYDTMLLKDLVQRHDPSHPRQCIEVCGYLLSCMGRPYTLKSAYCFLKAAGHATSRDAVRDYVAWAEDSWLLFSVPIHASSAKEEERNYRKAYCVDWALAARNSPVWDGTWSRALENLVFLQLHRTWPRVRYYLTGRTRQEVDFLVSDRRGEPVLAVQVCWDPSHPDTLRRELEPLVATARHFGTRENFIVTLEHEARYERDGVVVHAVPAWRWLLDHGGGAA